MKITNQDICKILKAQDGKDWLFGFGHHGPDPIPCFYRKDYIGSLKDSKSMIIINQQYNGFSAQEVKDYFNQIDWAETLKNATDLPYKRLFTQGTHKFVQHHGENKKCIVFTIPKKVETIIQNELDSNKTLDK